MVEKVIGIGGGVGPMAGVKLHELIIQHTLSRTDQGHLSVVHISHSSQIPDRTKFLLGEIKEDPAEAMILVMQAIAAAAKAAGAEEVVAGVPCNTFHAPRIWKDFTRMLKEKSVCVQVVHMLEETAGLIKEMLPNAQNIGLMSTTGTRKVGVYEQILTPLGYRLLQVPQKLQDELHDSIYNPEWGIKAVSPVTVRARDNFLRYTEILYDQGVDAIILGCTEIPLALPESKYQGVHLIDPMVALARALIRESTPAKLKPLHT
ncbi:aspartate/glutamate racemase family protein [Candidatus Daviesbacteria bacterium]|nr:aspartate/glutamate racemase family protein [Candidatus Daviesbacteria bacterium]